jgi:hypothetical protein
MNKTLLTLLISLSFAANAQVGIGTTTPSASAALDISSTTKGILTPRMTQAQRTAITSPATGLLTYQTDGTSGYYYYNGTAWQLFGSNSVWNLSGNTGTVIATNKLGTTDAQPLIGKTNNIEAFRILSDGKVGLGTSTPVAKLQVNYSSTPTYTDGFEDNSLTPFTTGFITAGSNWTITNTAGEFNTGSYGAKSGGFNVNSSNSYMNYTTAAIPASGGSVTFAYSTSTESVSYDYLIFTVDGVEQGRWGGVTAWTTTTYLLTSGVHALRWAYIKDSSLNGNNDAVYVDDITIANYVAPLRIVDGNQASGNVMVSDASGNGSWTSPTSFISGDDDWRFNSGNTSADPIYRTGDALIGNTGTAGYKLQVYNGTSNSTQIGLGSSEYVTDGESELLASNSVSPITNNSINIGSSSLRWDTIYATNGAINTSDKRDKEAIKPLRYGLKELLLLKPVSYKWKEEKYGKTILQETEKRTKIGFIAQELKELLPEVVQDKEWIVTNDRNQTVYERKKTSSMGVSYSEIIPVVVKATQEHQATINDIKKQQEKLSLILKKLEEK